jgi:hypothetical protein
MYFIDYFSVCEKFILIFDNFRKMKQIKPNV